MTQVEKYIEDLFRKIPSSSKARKYKSVLISECRVKFDKLRKSKKNDNEASAEVIAGIGTLSELRDSLPATGLLTNIIAALFFIVFFTACFFAAYYRITDESFEKMFVSFIDFLKIAFLRPMRWGTGGFLILWTLARYSKIGGGIRFGSLSSRMFVLAISVLFFLFYFFALACFWGSLWAPLTASLSGVFNFLWRSGQYFFAVPGAALFLGLRR